MFDKNLDSRKDSVLTKVFIDNNDIVFEYNDYKKRMVGSYQYDGSQKKLKGWWYYPYSKRRDTLFAQVVTQGSNGMKLITGSMGNEKLQIELKKLPAIKPEN